MPTVAFLNIDLTSCMVGLIVFFVTGICVIGCKNSDWSGPPGSTRTPSSPAQPNRASVREQLREIDWYQFEKISARILSLEDWSVTAHGGANPDGGADMIAVRDGCSYVVQCKHWRKLAITPNIIRELIGTRASTQFLAGGAILFTLSDCTAAALEAAKANRVQIRNADHIAESIARLGAHHFPELTYPNDKSCPKCDASMVYREAFEGSFWGCSTFPRCRGTIKCTNAQVESARQQACDRSFSQPLLPQRADRIRRTDLIKVGRL